MSKSDSRRTFIDHESTRAAILEQYGGHEGYAILPWDEPAEGLRGYFVFRNGSGVSDEEGCCYVWPITGVFLKPRVSVVEDAEELAAFLEDHPDAVPANDSRRTLLGFAHYDTEAKVSLVCQIRTDVLKRAEDQFKGPILAKTEQPAGSMGRYKDAAALSAALRNSGRN